MSSSSTTTEEREKLDKLINNKERLKSAEESELDELFSRKTRRACLVPLNECIFIDEVSHDSDEDGNAFERSERKSTRTNFGQDNILLFKDTAEKIKLTDEFSFFVENTFAELDQDKDGLLTDSEFENAFKILNFSEEFRSTRSNIDTRNTIPTERANIDQFKDILVGIIKKKYGKLIFGRMVLPKIIIGVDN